MRLFTTTWRFYVAVILVIGSIGSLFSLGVKEFAAGIIVSVLLILPELLYFLKPAASIWKKWDESASSQKQQDRIDRARSGDLTPRWVDVKGKIANFTGSDGGVAYKTTLKKCSCPDFTMLTDILRCA